MRRSISDSQRRILDFIRAEIVRNGYPPSVREICAGVGLHSTSTVHAHLEKLELLGYIRRDPSHPRAMEVLDGSTDKGRAVPLVGSVTAGEPILAQQNIEGYIPLPYETADTDTLFCLRVRGESMIEAGILDGDIIVVREQRTAENGEIVVALLGDEATVKRIYFEEKHVRLQPENRAMQPLFATEVHVLGKVIGLFRRF